MGRTRTAKIIELLKRLKEKSEIISFEELKKEIMLNIGSSIEQTVRPTIKNMQELNFVEDAGEGNVRIKL